MTATLKQEKHAGVAADEDEKAIFHDGKDMLFSRWLTVLNGLDLALECFAPTLHFLVIVVRRILARHARNIENIRDSHRSQADIHRKESMRMRMLSEKKWHPRAGRGLNPQPESSTPAKPSPEFPDRPKTSGNVDRSGQGFQP